MTPQPATPARTLTRAGPFGVGGIMKEARIVLDVPWQEGHPPAVRLTVLDMAQYRANLDRGREPDEWQATLTALPPVPRAPDGFEAAGPWEPRQAVTPDGHDPLILWRRPLRRVAAPVPAGPRVNVAPLERFLLSAFSVEQSRLLVGRTKDVEDQQWTLPERSSPAQMVRAVAPILATLPPARLREVLVEERPKREKEIDRVLAEMVTA